MLRALIRTGLTARRGTQREVGAATVRERFVGDRGKGRSLTLADTTGVLRDALMQRTVEDSVHLTWLPSVGPSSGWWGVVQCPQALWQGLAIAVRRTMGVRLARLGNRQR